MRENIEIRGRIHFSDKIIIFFSYFLLIIDSINGYFLENNVYIPISLLFKNIWIILIIYRLLRQNNALYIIAIFIYVNFIYLNLLINGVSVEFGDTFIHLFKFLTTILLFLYFRYLVLEYDQYIFPKIRKIFLINGCVIIFSILLGPLGFGYLQYGNTYTYRGFFYAGNELSGALLVIVPFLLYWIADKKKYYYLFSVIFLIVGVLIGTKTGLVAILLSVLFIPIIKQKRKKSLFSIWFKYSFYLLLFSLFLYLLFHFMNNSGFLYRWESALNKGGIDELIFSGRTSYWEEERNEFFHANIWMRLFGLGGNRTVEMDIHDTLLNYGYIGCLVVYSFFLTRIIFAYRVHSSLGRLVVFVDILFLFASSLSGHLIYSATANTFLALMNALVYFDMKKKHESTVII